MTVSHLRTGVLVLSFSVSGNYLAKGLACGDGTCRDNSNRQLYEDDKEALASTNEMACTKSMLPMGRLIDNGKGSCFPHINPLLVVGCDPISFDEGNRDASLHDSGGLLSPSRQLVSGSSLNRSTPAIHSGFRR